MFNPGAAVVDGSLAYLLFRSAHDLVPHHIWLVMSVFVLWLIFTKTVKLLPHFYRYPEDIKYLPMHFLFGYLHGLIKLYALVTLYKVSCVLQYCFGLHSLTFPRLRGKATSVQEMLWKMRDTWLRQTAR